MYRRAAIAAFLLTALRAAPQATGAASGPVILKSTSRVVQLEVVVSDSSGRPVHGLQKNDFVVTDNGRPRDIRIFGGETDVQQTAPSSATAPSPGVYSNRLGMRDARMVTAIVLDDVPRPDGLQQNRGIGAFNRPELWLQPEVWLQMVRVEAVSAIHRMEPGQVIAIYAACPELRVVQDYTSDPDRLAASLNSFVPPRRAGATGKKQPRTIDTLVPPMLAALREVAGGMSGASGRKSIVWISQAYGTEMSPSAMSEETESAIAALNAADVTLYAVDTRFSPTCESPANIAQGQGSIVPLTCSQPPDISDEWMEYVARATGGRAFSGGNAYAFQERDAQGKLTRATYGLQSDRGLVDDAIHFAADDSRYTYEMGFYVSESELDGEVHRLGVTVPAHPKLVLRYRSGYTATTSAATTPPAQGFAEPDSTPTPASPLNPDEVGIDATIDTAAGAKNELRISLALAPKTVTKTADGVIVIEAAFTQTAASGKELAKVEETVRVPSPEAQTEMVRYSRVVKLIKGAALLHVTIRDQATNRAGSIAIPIGKQ
jgi:hypothetical protein